MNTNDKVFDLSAILYENDPMNTCCVENECIDEYDSVSEDIVISIEDGMPIELAIKTILNTSFCPMRVSDEDIEVIVAEIKASEIF